MRISLAFSCACGGFIVYGVNDRQYHCHYHTHTNRTTALHDPQSKAPRPTASTHNPVKPLSPIPTHLLEDEVDHLADLRPGGAARRALRHLLSLAAAGTGGN